MGMGWDGIMGWHGAMVGLRMPYITLIGVDRPALAGCTSERQKGEVLFVVVQTLRERILEASESISF